MKLNCKPGDLAVIVLGWSQLGGEHAGKIIRVINLIQEDLWDYEPKLPCPEGGFYSCACDLALRPIRDPGDDAVDETLQWLPVAFPQLEHA